MKINSKVAALVIGMAFTGSAVYAQSLDDAKKAITAEQYQKAKTMLKNLTVTQADKDENYFYLGWVYLKQDEPDSAKLWFTKGIGVNAKSSLNYVGLGAVAHLDKDAAGTTSNFNQAITLSNKKDAKPFVYIGKSYLLSSNGAPVATADAQAALDVLKKGQAVNPKDAELFITLGDANRALGDANSAYSNFTDAQAIDPKSPAANVELGITLKNANNFEDAIKDFQAAIALDPNYGPAYREWAETDARWAKTEPTLAVAKDDEAIEEYKKYLSLTDMSLESQMRYADFLITAGKYQELEDLTKQLSSSASTNLRVYRYLAYAAYENKDYAAGLTAINTWLAKADPKRIIPRDYLYLGRLQIATGNDSLGVQNLRKAYDMDSTQADLFAEIAKSDYKHGKYLDAAEAYKTYTTKSNKATLNDHLSEGLSYYKQFTTEYYSKATPKPVPDTTLLTRADSAFAYVQRKASAPVAVVALYQAREQDFKEPDRNAIKGFAKPFYEQYITLLTAKGIKDTDKPFLAEAYDYLGRYYELVAKDETKAADAYSKALANDPADAGALDYNKRKGIK